MAKRLRKTKTILALLILILLIHSILQITVYGTGISDFFEKGISGFSVGNFSLGDDLKQKYTSISLTSKIILLIELILILAVIAFILIKSKASLKKEVQNIDINLNRDRKNKTDLDILYGLLKKKKHLRLSSITKVFDVDKNTALNWCKTLESADLVTIDYPRFGEPDIEFKK
jgi:hypothetical protein